MYAHNKNPDNSPLLRPEVDAGILIGCAAMSSQQQAVNSTVSMLMHPSRVGPGPNTLCRLEATCLCLSNTRSEHTL